MKSTEENSYVRVSQPLNPKNPSEIFSFKFLTPVKNICLGISHITDSKSDQEWYLNLVTGELVNPNEEMKQYFTDTIQEGDTISIALFGDEIHFWLNEKELGVADKDSIFLDG